MCSLPYPNYQKISYVVFCVQGASFFAVYLHISIPITYIYLPPKLGLKMLMDNDDEVQNSIYIVEFLYVMPRRLTQAGTTDSSSSKSIDNRCGLA